MRTICASKCWKDDSCRRAENSLQCPVTNNALACGRNAALRCEPNPLASVSSSCSVFFGSGRLSIFFRAGRFKGILPLGSPAALRIAASSQSIQASDIFTGITKIKCGFGQCGGRRSMAAAISRCRFSGGSLSESLWINRISQGNKSIAIGSRSATPRSGRPKEDKSANWNSTKSSGKCCSHNHRMMGCSAASLVPSARRVKRRGTDRFTDPE
ncbi:MAG: hypothetical protein JWL81_1001 [Verrucomicrobiales bacterium]|nr:hypothetical protein [Verrucomicrobiales bacterium]